jgi:hypothetical protein
MGTEQVLTGFLWGINEGKTPLGTPKSRWENNTKMDLQEVGCENGLD